MLYTYIQDLGSVILMRLTLRRIAVFKRGNVLHDIFKYIDFYIYISLRRASGGPWLQGKIIKIFVGVCCSTFSRNRFVLFSFGESINGTLQIFI